MVYGREVGAVMRSGLGKHEVLVLLALLTSMEADGASTAAISALAKTARLSVRMVQDVIPVLVSSGWISREDRRGNRTVWRYTGPGVVPDRVEGSEKPPHRVHPRTVCTPAPCAPDPRTPCTPPPHTVHPEPPMDRTRAVPSSDPVLVQRESTAGARSAQVVPATLPLPFLDTAPPRVELPPCTSVSDLERLAMNCRDDVDRRGRGRGLMLDAVSAAKLVELAAAFGVPAVDAALRDSGGTERPVAHAAAILEGKGRPPSAGTRKPRRAGSAPPAADPISAAWAGAVAPNVEELGEGE